MSSTITVTGDTAAARHLRAIGTRAGRQRRTFEKEARDAQRRITGVPVDTGALERSVRGGSGTLRTAYDEGYRIGTTVPYARFVFGGTKRMPARPPKVPNDLGQRSARAVGDDLKRA